MKRPIVFLSLFFLSIICSTVIVTTAVSSLCKSFYKEDGSNSSVKTIKADKVDTEIMSTAVKF